AGAVGPGDRRDARPRLTSAELGDPDVPEVHLVRVPVVLQADVTGGQVPVRVGGVELVDDHAVERDGDRRVVHLDDVGVPLSRRVERSVACLLVGSLGAVDRSGGAVRRVGGVDLDLIALGDGDPRVVPGI